MAGKRHQIVVIGGGIVGVSNALALQKAGHQVTLIDRGTPGRETSYGNPCQSFCSGVPTACASRPAS